MSFIVLLPRPLTAAMMHYIPKQTAEQQEWTMQWRKYVPWCKQTAEEQEWTMQWRQRMQARSDWKLAQKRLSLQLRRLRARGELPEWSLLLQSLSAEEIEWVTERAADACCRPTKEVLCLRQLLKDNKF